MCPSVMTKDGKEIGSTDALREYGVTLPSSLRDGNWCLCDIPSLSETLGENWVDVNNLKRNFPCLGISFLIEYYEKDEDGKTFPERRKLSRKERKMMKNRAIRQQSQRR